MKLNQLRILYQKFCDENKILINPAMWNNQFIKNEVDLKNFRKDGAYIWQVRMGDGKKNYRKYYKYIKQRDRLNLLSKTFEDGLFGVNYFTIDKKKISRDLLDSINEIYFLENQLKISEKDNYNILDIGAGYGRLAHRMLDCFNNINYYTVDAIPVSTYLCNLYLNHYNQSNVILLPDIKNFLSLKQINLAINVHSFPEMNIHDIEWWINLISNNNIEFLFIIPNIPNTNQNLLPTNKGENIIPLLNQYNYELIHYENKYKEPFDKELPYQSKYYLFSLI